MALVEELVVEDREAIGQKVADHQLASKHYRSVARNKGALSKSEAHVAGSTALSAGVSGPERAPCESHVRTCRK